MSDGRDFDTCAVCGRTILRGERVTEYVTQDGSPAGVCALCKTAAEDAGWVPAALAGARTNDSPRRRSLGLRQRLARVSSAARGLAARPESDSADHPAEQHPAVGPTRGAAKREGGGRHESGEMRAGGARRPERTRPAASGRRSERGPAPPRPRRRPTRERLLR
ncbi:MAG TPA: hypothetical protein VK919_03395, partial [Solirubrobacterales bacterium]|nr:hypothetical protein [Solirubrobacterales bacterium]